VPATTVAVAPTTRAPAGADRCHTAGLSLQTADGEGSTGHFISFYELRNTTSERCRLVGSPAVAVLDGQGGVLAEARKAAGFTIKITQASTVNVAPGQSAWFAVEWTNLCDAPRESNRIRVTPPGERQALSVDTLLRVCGPGSILVSPITADKSEITRR